jgi:hypothetical protein
LATASTMSRWLSMEDTLATDEAPVAAWSSTGGAGRKRAQALSIIAAARTRTPYFMAC